MSYILDALKRAERERKQGPVSVLEELPVASSGEQAKPRLPQAWLVALAAIVPLAVLIAVLSWRHHDSGDAGAASSAALNATQPAVPGNPAPRPVIRLPAPALVPHEATPAPAPAATIEDGGKIATFDDVDSAAPAPGQRPNQAAAAPLPQIAAASPAAAAQAARRTAPAASSDTADTDTTAAASAAATEPAAASDTTPDAAAAGSPAAAAPDAAPEQTAQPPAQHPLREMPEEFRANFPAFTVDVHAYNDNPRQRFVIISGKRYHEGDTLAEGPRVIGIVPDGIVLDWQGQQVLYAIAH